MATMNVSLPDPMKEWVEDQDAQNKRELLVKALHKGEKSGISKRTLDDIWNDVKASKR